MLSFLVVRLIRTTLALVFVSALIFVLLRLSGDPVSIMLPLEASAAERSEFRRQLGLDAPLAIQYMRFLARAVHGDFGESIRYRQSAWYVFTQRLPATLTLVAIALSSTVLLGFLLGIIAALRRDSVLDHALTGASLALQSTPSFWVGIMLILLFSIRLGWLPTSGSGSWKHLVMPVLTVSTFLLAEIVILVRGSMVEVLAAEYIRTARAKGAHHSRVVVHHALRNALIPSITIIGLQFGTLIGGSVITETVFGWPGVGLLAVQSIFNRDFPVVQVTVLVLAVLIAVANLVVDLLYVVVDPRVRVSG